MADPIHALVFSKDRAMQLDAFLRSARGRAPYAWTTLIYDASTDRHARSYHTVRDEADDVCLGAAVFENAVRAAVKNAQRIVFHTDDEVWYRTPEPAHLWDVDDAVICTHLGRNTTYCHPLDAPQTIPGTFPRWDWRAEQAAGNHDFGYPLSLNGCVFRSEWILPLLDFPFTNPTQLEAGLAARARERLIPSEMVAPFHSCTVSLPHNRVSVDSGCPHGANPEWSADALCEKYLDGWRIDLDRMDFATVNAAHVEVPLEFKRV